MVKTRLALEGQYRHIPADHTPWATRSTRPRCSNTPVPLHDSAQQRAIDDLDGEAPAHRRPDLDVTHDRL